MKSAEPASVQTNKKYQVLRKHLVDDPIPFEILVSFGDEPPVVVFRREGVAPEESYARNVEML